MFATSACVVFLVRRGKMMFATGRYGCAVDGFQKSRCEGRGNRLTMMECL